MRRAFSFKFPPPSSFLSSEQPPAGVQTLASKEKFRQEIVSEKAELSARSQVLAESPSLIKKAVDSLQVH